MRDQLTKLVRHTAIYGLGRMVSKGISFLLIPFYTHYFATAEYGLMEILNLAVMIAAIALAPGLSNAVMRFYYDTEDQEERNLTVSTALVFCLVVGVAAATLMTLHSAWISEILLASPKYGTLVKLLAVGFFFSFFSDICLVFLRSKQQSGVYVFLTQAFLILSIGLNIYFVAARKLGVSGVFISNAIASTIFGTSLLYLTVREVGITFSARKLLAMLHFGAPLILTWLAAFVLNFSDRFFLQRYASLSQVGIYSVGYKFGYILSLMLVQPFNLTWEPQAYEIAKQENGREIFAQIFTVYSVILFSCAFLISLFIREVFAIMVDPKFFVAYQLVPLIAFAYVCQGMQGFFEAGLLIKKKSQIIGLIGFTCTVLCLLLNLALIYLWTTWGACIATFLSLLAMALVSYWYSQRHFPLRLNVWPLLKISAIGGVMLLGAWMLPLQSTVVRAAAKLGLAVLYAVIVYKMDIFPAQDVAEVRRASTEWLRNRLGVTQAWLQAATSFLNGA